MKQSKFLKPIGLLLLALLLVAVVVAPAAAQEPEGDVSVQIIDFTDFLWNPDDTLIARGDGTVLTKFNVIGAQQFSGFTFQVEYDASVIKPEDVEPGSLLPGTAGVDYFFNVQTGFPGNDCGDAAFAVNVVYFDPTVQINGTGDLFQVLWRSDPDAAVGDVGDICVDGAESEVVDNGGAVGPAVPSVYGIITIEPPSIFKFQIGLEGGKNSGLEEPTSSDDIITEVTINGIYPCDGGMVDIDGFCTFNNATALPPYEVQVSRFGYLDATSSFDDPEDSSAIWLWAGDLNDDNVVNILDIQLMVSVLNAPVGTSPLSVAADFTGPGAPPTPDGVVNIIDLVLLAKNFGMGGPTDGSPGGGGSFPF